MNFKALFTWLLTISYCYFIYYLSSKTKLPDAASLFEGEDKIMHAGAYFIMGLLFFISFLSSDFKLKKAGILSFIFTTLYGISDEIHQYFVPNRNMDLLDLLADMLGAYMGILFTILIKNNLSLKNYFTTNLLSLYLILQFV